ncbi:sigma-70 family RNA polymerase sigma factor [Agromyces sp. SYSU K20354]|uniref:RNA polymerase sigma factor n=1 Tax=Agromyces cavernae TaxID=2898659 RepID=UPI001E512B22|nr:sigma-70 family RNA polymerase sigma factor [Agromyces cavernae]MCD2441820.1 sigma-70 family RNA polymerase sigma factor [Agromyces cavernae]
MSDDSEVIGRSIEEPAQFAVLFDRHARTVHNYAARRVGSDDANDIMSETFLVAFERRGDFDLAVASARPWLLGIATRVMHRHVRVEARAWRGMVAALAAEVSPDLIDQAGGRIDATRLTRRLRAALRGLHARDRDVLLLYAWGDLDYSGIAAALEIPVGTVRSRLNRARRAMRAAAGLLDSEDTETEHGRAAAAAPSA